MRALKWLIFILVIFCLVLTVGYVLWLKYFVIPEFRQETRFERAQNDVLQELISERDKKVEQYKRKEMNNWDNRGK